MSVLDDDIAHLQQEARELQDNDPQIQELQEQMTRKARGKRAAAKVISAPQAVVIERITTLLPRSLFIFLAPACRNAGRLLLFSCCATPSTAPAGPPL